MSVKAEVIKVVSELPGITDGEIPKKFGKRNQVINSACLALEKEGYLIRRILETEKRIGNYSTGKLYKLQDILVSRNENSSQKDFLQEEDVKRILTDYLKDQGWEVETAWGHLHGVDINAKRNGKKWLIEVKGPGSRDQMRQNYFQNILGEMLQRMDTVDARYSIAFPDMKQYRRLWGKFPSLAKERTGIDMILVNIKGNIEILK